MADDMWAGIPVELREKVEEWERLANEAMSGPWVAHKHPLDYNHVRQVVPTCTEPQHEDCAMCQTVAIDLHRAKGNAAFIAAAREAVPELCSALRSLVSRLQEAEKERDALRAFILALGSVVPRVG